MQLQWAACSAAAGGQQATEMAAAGVEQSLSSELLLVAGDSRSERAGFWVSSKKIHLQNVNLLN